MTTASIEQKIQAAPQLPQQPQQSQLPQLQKLSKQPEPAQLTGTAEPWSDPFPTTTLAQYRKANPDILCHETDICFSTVLDMITRDLLWTYRLIVDEYNGKVYHNTGKEVYYEIREGYAYVKFSLPCGLTVHLPVHRLVYLKVYPRSVLYNDIDIHHKDKNKLNNRISNLQAIPRDIHTLMESVQRMYIYKNDYRRLTCAQNKSLHLTKEQLTALRVCACFSHIEASQYKTVIYQYFARSFQSTVKYVIKLANGRAGNSVAGKPTEADIKRFLKEFDWLISGAKKGMSLEQIEKQHQAVQTTPAKTEQNAQTTSTS